MNLVHFQARVVLLDWDGTLLDSYAADLQAYLAMFRAFEIEWGVRELECHYSPDWYRVYRAARLPRSKWKEADRLWRAAYRAERPPLLPSARKVLRTLEQEFRLGLVTGGSRGRVRRQLREFGLRDFFSACVCGEDAPRRKPHPAPLELALKRLRAEPGDCVYVGDAPEDIEMARRAGVKPIGVLGPFPTAERIRAARPDLLLRSIGELPRHLRRRD
ncbi:MAG TPA: HAD family hydrolase [Candidatus Polarisedimenticolia bacterium]|nr:HAD family hydrolase [Candidatus Polarisedimenticolia bacterium]